MQGGNWLRSAFLIAILLVALGCGAATASASSGGTSAPSGGGTTPSSSSSSTGTRDSSGATTPSSSTGGISPTYVKPPTAPVKPKKKRRKRRRRNPPAVVQPAPITPAPTPAATADIPARFLAIYKAAGSRYGVDWRILAAIGKNESDHGRSTAPGVLDGLNFADCCSGPMQICTVKSCSNVWQHYAVDGDGDGLASVYDPNDAIYGAAWLLYDLQAIVGPDPKLLLAAYNAGPGNVTRYKGVPPFPETKAYVRAGLAYIATLS